MGNKEISRRGFLKLVGLGSASIFVSGCGGIYQTAQPKEISAEPSPLKVPIETEIPPTIEPSPTKRIESTPTPPEVKEKEPRILWTINTGRSFSIGEDRVSTITGEGLVRTFDIATGTQLWQWEGEWETRGSILEIDPEHIYLGREDSRFYALDARSGKEIWKITLAKMLGPGESWSLVAQDKDRLYLNFSRQPYGALSAHEYLLVAIDKNNGAMLWSRPGELLSLWEIIPGRTEQTLLWASPLQGIDPATGETKWHLSEYGFDAVSEGTFFAGANRPLTRIGIAAFEIDSGRKLWQTKPEYEGIIREISPISIYVGGEFSSFWVLDRQTGQTLWARGDISPGFLGEFEEIAILSDRSSGFVWAVSPRTGQVFWENDDLVLNEVVGISQNTLIGLRYWDKGFLYGIDFQTGKRKWRVEYSPAGVYLWYDLDQPRPKPDKIRLGPRLLHDKIVDISSNNLLFFDSETGETVSTISFPHNIEYCLASFKQDKQGLLFVKDSNSLSAIRI